ncbi:MAG: polysaccharide biosynthesis/export family protein [Cytophagaceae bacterium]|nr:polysaccharide biosynthesis/export family protein [Cytophagaceae bacterium]
MRIFTILFLALPAIISCQRNILFQSGEDHFERTMVSTDSGYVYRLQAFDKLSISVWNHEDISVGSIYGIYNSNEVYGKWILLNEKGAGEFPLIGSLSLQGLSIQEAEDSLKKTYQRVIKNPILTLRVLNKKISVVGEVIKPGNYLLEKDNHNLVEIIAEAGGFDYYANKKKITIIRTVNGITCRKTIDLTQLRSLDNNNCLIQNGDILYIPPTSSKKIDKKTQTLIPLASVVTATILLLKFLTGTL